MRSSIFLRTLRSFRTAILGWGLGMGVVMLAVVTAYDKLIGDASPAAKQAIVAAFQSVSWLWDYPHAGDSAGGYATAKYGSILALVAIWALLAGSRIVRGEEESGQIDMLLSTPRSRVRVVVEKLSALLVALLIIGVCIGLGSYLGVVKSTHTQFSFSDAMLQGLMVSLLAASFGAIAVFVSQFTRHRGTAAGITGALFAIAFVLNSISLVATDNDWVGRLSPVWYYRISKPLVEGYGMNWGAAGILALITVVFGGLGAALFLTRDVGSAIPVVPAGVSLPAGRLGSAQGNWSLASLISRSFALELPRALWWSVALGLFYFAFTGVVHQLQVNLVDSFKGTNLEKIFNAMAGGAGGDALFLSLIFAYLPVLITALAIGQVSGWERVEQEGQLDLVLATPQQRAKVLLARIGAAALGLVITVAVTYGAVVLSAAKSNLSLDGGKLASAVLGVLPFGLIFLGFGYLLATWIRRGLVVTVMSFVLAIEYGLQLVGQILQWPDNALRTSLFYYYNSPLLHGLDWTATIIITALAVVFTGLAVWRFAAKDIGIWRLLLGLGGGRQKAVSAAG